MTAKGIFITGTGTGVGKTHVSALLLRGFSRIGQASTYMKPVETGCERCSGGKALAGADTLFVLGFAERKTGIDLHSPYRFEPACSPHLAARLENCEIDVSHIVSAYNDLSKETAADIIIVEGAGGLLVPVAENNVYMADVAEALGLSAVIVTEPDLGTLNHTFLSLRELERRAIPLAGVVINNARNVERNFIYEDNVEIICRHVAPVPCLDVDYSGMPITSSERYDILSKRITEFCNNVISRV